MVNIDFTKSAQLRFSSFVTRFSKNDKRTTINKFYK